MPRCTRRFRALARATEPRPQLKLLFALCEADEPSESLLHVLELAQLLDAELHVLRVIPEFAERDGRVDGRDGRAVDETLRYLRATQAWLTEALGRAPSHGHLLVYCGSFVEQTAAYAQQLGAELIAVPSRPGRFGTTVTKLAQTAGLPVLVARASCTIEAIVAATDLSDSAFPVLRKASEFSGLYDAPVIAVHNVVPLARTVGMGGAVWVVPEEHAAATVARQRSRLARASRQVPAQVEPVLSTGHNVAAAVLREAGEREAELVLVGTRTRTWLSRLRSGSVAAQIVNGASQSVLVTPLDPAPPPLATSATVR